MARIEEPINMEETVVRVNRCTTVTKGGKSMSFSALVVVGDKKGSVGIGFGKAREVPNAVSKAVKEAKKQIVKIPLKGGTIPHVVWGRFKAANIFLKPASPGTGIKAGASARAVLESAGVKNILTKCYGKRNPLNVAKATLFGLKSLRTKEEIGELRGVKIE
ncbi:MAG: 30S ribosomal protein S5 [Candidatus Brocadia sinica]|uniref:Small ribosomal subunit protein uS5 n=2 Tax=Candidatus Brocadiaceae TaxID=1127830 RepID=A0ABQ0JY15_9BACT|nr:MULTISPECIES: 30S ribosomal protein S5 [Brocadia]KXK26347.1 MAG: 30S ribosomal protein S5 [Candidatus Brocadia sinica]MCK6467588.1 30S ribosomal protein S5 [Candidatus Brocadia sinica]GAN33683.1 ribosomal protein S5 [Candidatus Brocadia sinica JPN1]GIK13510.1 MAG: 30S ribosomal protein S5 [Candidatus Brocadia sinica]GJQ17239.1 MAG: 30S ribosomal protein S5 [Candidatus Brocadia sinica]